MEIVKHGDNMYKVKFRHICPTCGAELLYDIWNQMSLPDMDGVFCPECFTFLNHENSERILIWLNKNGEANEEEKDDNSGGTRYR